MEYKGYTDLAFVPATGAWIAPASAVVDVDYSGRAEWDGHGYAIQEDMRDPQDPPRYFEGAADAPYEF